MNAHEVIDAYVRDVASCLPRGKRNDVAFELRSLLGDELSAKAQIAGRAPDSAMAMDLLRKFGRPAEAAARYHQRPAVIDATDTHHFVIWGLAGAVTISLVSQLNPSMKVQGSDEFLKWIGSLLIVFALMAWWRRRHPNRFGWKPKRDPNSVSRWPAVLAMVGTLIFPVFMYAAPQKFVSTAFMGRIPSSGLELTDAFAASPERALTMTLLIVLAALHGVLAVQRERRRWAGWTSVITYGGLGLLFAAHAAPMTARPGGVTFFIFKSARSNEIAMPIFALLGAFMLLCSLYEAYREWARIRPAPELNGDGTHAGRGRSVTA